jgi:hypothetical protein
MSAAAVKRSTSRNASSVLAMIAGGNLIIHYFQKMGGEIIA